MGMTVAIMPRLFVAVVLARRHQSIEHLRIVLLESRFELDRADRGRTPDRKHVDDADLDTGFSDDPIDFRRDVVHVAVFFRSQFDLSLERHGITKLELWT